MWSPSRRMNIIIESLKKLSNICLVLYLFKPKCDPKSNFGSVYREQTANVVKCHAIWEAPGGERVAIRRQYWPQSQFRWQIVFRRQFMPAMGDPQNAAFTGFPHVRAPDARTRQTRSYILLPCAFDFREAPRPLQLLPTGSKTYLFSNGPH